MFGALLRVAFQVVQNVLSQLTQQFNIVEQMALSPMRAIVQAVTGGVWIGKGADKFVEEVSQIMIPGVGKVNEQIKTVSGNLQRAQDVMQRADQQVNSMVNSLGDMFGGIFSS